MKLETTEEGREYYKTHSGVANDVTVRMLCRDIDKLRKEYSRARDKGQEDVLRFIREGRFLSDDAPSSKFAREVEEEWRRHGKAAVKE